MAKALTSVCSTPILRLANHTSMAKTGQLFQKIRLVTDTNVTRLVRTIALYGCQRSNSFPPIKAPIIPIRAPIINTIPAVVKLWCSVPVIYNVITGHIIELPELDSIVPINNHFSLKTRDLSVKSVCINPPNQYFILA